MILLGFRTKQLLPCYQNSYTTGCFIRSATYVPIRWNIGAVFSESERSFRSPTEQWKLRQSYCSIRERSRALALLNAARISHFVYASFGGKCFHLLKPLMYIYWQDWKYTSFVDFIRHYNSQNIWRYNALCEYKLFDGCRRKHWIKSPIQGSFSIRLILHNL